MPMPIAPQGARDCRRPIRAQRSLFVLITVAAVALGWARPASSQAVAPAAAPVRTPALAATFAPSPAPAAQPSGQLTVADWLKQPQMLGDWGGARTRMGEQGLQIDASWTQFFVWAPRQSPTGDERGFDYGGKVDIQARQDFTSWGWEGVSATAHIDFRYGDTTLLAGGTLLPTNTALIFPDREGEEIDVTSLYLSKVFGTSTILSAGRFNMVKLYDRTFTGGEGVDKFMNIAFVTPPFFARTVPPTVEGIMMTTLRNAAPFVTAGLLESTEDGFFENGATVYGSVELPIQPFRVPGRYTVTGSASSILATSLDQSPYAIIPIFDVPLEQKRGAWTLDFSADQYIWWDPNNKTGWGVFGTFAVTDGNPSPVDFFATVGAGGMATFFQRPQDNWGAGYFYNGVSEDLRDSLEPFVRLRSEQGMEIFYNYAITGWSKVGADLQIVDPFAVGSKTRTFFSLRWKLVF